jgi:predicted GH43/DUF377 family glycosyl hydrolase
MRGNAGCFYSPDSSLNRRAFVLSLLAGEPIPERLKTPHKLPRLVLGPSGVAGSFDEKSVDCPFVFTHQGRFWMTYAGFDGTGYQTGLASSADLVNWRREGLVFPRDPSSAILRYNAALTWIVRENGLFSPGRLKKSGGRYLGVYHAYPKPGYEEGPAVIGLCWSRDLRRWEADPPCLRAEDGADWERGGLYKACLVEEKGVFHLFYNAKTAAARRWVEQTGAAWSRDLKSWRRYEGNPILANGPAGSPDEVFASDPCVLKFGRRWAMFYYSLDRKGVARDLLAVSADLRRFTKCEGVLIDIGPPGSIDSRYAHKPAVIAHQGALYHFYCAVSRENVRGIAVASSVPLSG